MTLPSTVCLTPPWNRTTAWWVSATGHFNYFASTSSTTLTSSTATVVVVSSLSSFARNVVVVSYRLWSYYCNYITSTNAILFSSFKITTLIYQKLCCFTVGQFLRKCLSPQMFIIWIGACFIHAMLFIFFTFFPLILNWHTNQKAKT